MIGSRHSLPDTSSGYRSRYGTQSSSDMSGKSSSSGPSRPTPSAERLYHRMRSGGGSPCAFSHPITGLRSTPIFSISASTTSPGFR